MGLKWHRLNHIQTICNLLQTDNHAQHSSLILMGQMSSLRQTNGVQTLKIKQYTFSYTVPLTTTKLGEQAFMITNLTGWNISLSDIGQVSDTNTFKHHLKTYF